MSCRDTHPYWLDFSSRHGTEEHVRLARRYVPGRRGYCLPHAPRAVARRAAAELIRTAYGPAALSWLREDAVAQLPDGAFRAGERERLMRRLASWCVRRKQSRGLYRHNSGR